MVTTIHWWQILRIAKWVLKFDNKEQNWEKKLPDKRRLSSNWERGTNWVHCLLPVHLVCCLWASTQGRLREGTEQPGHVYFDIFNLHSLHRGGCLRVLGCCKWVFSFFHGWKVEGIKQCFQKNWPLNGNWKGPIMFQRVLSAGFLINLW